MILRKLSTDKFSIKKFYKEVHVKQNEKGFSVFLDKRQLKTPSGTPVSLHSQLLALALATEWNSQKDFIKLFAMPLNTLVTTATDLDKMNTRHLFETRVLSFFEADSFCYRDEEDDEIHAPVFAHMKKEFCIDFKICQGFDVPGFTESSLAIFKSHLSSLDHFHLVALESAVSMTKSVAIGEALLSQAIDISTALTIARLEEEKQIKENGRVEGSHDLDETYMLHGLSAARNLVVLKSWP